MKAAERSFSARRTDVRAKWWVRKLSGRCGLIERAGQGLNLMVESAIRQSKALPDFTRSTAHEVSVILNGTVQDPAFLRFLERVGAERLQSFSTHDFLALHAVRQQQPVPTLLLPRLPGLLESGVIERLGRGRGARYLLARGLYAAIGQRGAYTRERGLDHETNKALLLRHIEDNNREGSPLNELRQVLPALTGPQVQRLLHELRDAGRVQPQGQRRWARWHVSRKTPPEPENGS